MCGVGAGMIFEIPKQFIRGHNANINIHKRFPRPGGYKLQAAGGRLQATGNRLQARGIRAARIFRLQARGHRRQATSYRLQATGYKHHVLGWTPRSLRYDGGLSESSDFHLHLSLK